MGKDCVTKPYCNPKHIDQGLSLTNMYETIYVNCICARAWDEKAYGVVCELEYTTYDLGM